MTQKLTHEFVKHMPEALDSNKLYISYEFSMAMHLCACGCGHEVVTPLMTPPGPSPSVGVRWSEGWFFNPDTISLTPSILNRFACKSHYFIKDGEFVWA